MNLLAKGSLALSLTLLLAAGCKDDGEEGKVEGLTVMTQNVYFGFDVAPLLAAENPEEIPILAAQAFGQLIETNFAERAEALADEISRKRPHLIGLQEVALFRIQSPGDLIVGGSAPAETVLFDHLEILRAALAARGLEYAVAGKVQNADVELPMLASAEPLAFDDIRLTDFDVVLARADVSVSNVAQANYAAKLFVPSLGVEIPRGFVALDARLTSGRSYRFVNTHLEDVPFEEIQQAQAAELLAALASERKPVVLVGDFNSPALDGATYQFLMTQGFVDAWTRNAAHDAGPGLTWGHDPGLRNETVSFTMRLDLILVRQAPEAAPSGDLAFVLADVWGDEPADRTETGLWPSDHAGVTAELHIPTLLRVRK